MQHETLFNQKYRHGKLNLSVVTIGSVLLIGLSGTTAQAGENPFVMQELSSGYQLTKMDAAAQLMFTSIAKDKEGKCGEAKCGEGKCATKK